MTTTATEVASPAVPLPATGAAPGATPGAAWQRVDPASLVAFRVLLGALVCAASIRFMMKGWVDEHFVDPTFFFPYWGLDWVRPLPSLAMHAIYAVTAVAALGVAAGLFYRVSAATLFVLFTYAHLCDKTHYLNHYYLVSLLAALTIVLPLHHHGSVDAWRWKRRGGEARPWPRAWVLWLVRFQVGLVYFFGGVAKLGPDWLLHAQPLRTWLARSTDLPVFGWFFRFEATAYAMSWAGAAFDLSVAFLLSYRRTRPFAFVAVLAFHALVGQLFQLGMFPWFMPAFATILFDPSWPRRLLAVVSRGRLGASTPSSTSAQRPSARERIALGVAVVYAVVQVIVPLRHWLYPGNVLWTEEGFRFAWNVMLIEKNGVVTAEAVDRATGERFYVSPSDYLTPLQERMMSTQPDMILQFAHLARDDFRARGRDVAVYVDARVALNGRRSRPLVDPSVDLARESEGWGAKRWILPMPDEPPGW